MLLNHESASTSTSSKERCRGVFSDELLQAGSCAKRSSLEEKENLQCLAQRVISVDLRTGATSSIRLLECTVLMCLMANVGSFATCGPFPAFT